MRGYRALVLALLKSNLREPVGFFFLMVFSPMVLVVLGLIFGNEPKAEFGTRGFVDEMLPGMTVIAILVVAIMVVPQQQLVLRETGALTRLRITPLEPRTFVAADLTVYFVLGMVGALLTLVVGLTAFGVQGPANLLGVIGALAVGHLSMLAIGYTLATLYPSVAAATGIGNGLMIALVLTSGAMIPKVAMPDGVQAAMHFSPVYHVVELIRASWMGTAWPMVSVVVLLGILVVFGALATRLFRWDRVR